MPFRRILVISLACLFSLTALAQDGEALFETRCASCHLDPDPETAAHTPSLEAMQSFTPNSVYAALTTGPMQVQGTGLTDEQLRLLALTITGSSVSDVDLAITAGLCQDNPPLELSDDQSGWNGWGPDISNSRYAAQGGIRAEDLPDLRLKWAYGLPGEGQARGQPAVFAGRLFVGNSAGGVYSIDADSGCTYWSYLPRTGVRSATSVGLVERPDGSQDVAVFFVDAGANVYALDARSGEQLWVRKFEEHPAVRATGALTYHEGVLYVPMSAVSEESAASGAGYACCTFRGSLTAMDAETGDVLWRYFTVPEPQPRGTNADGTQLFGPAGVGIWSAPTVDAKRGLVYVATGNAYADPDPGTSDAVIAVDMQTGEQVWVNQLYPGDVWIGDCQPGSDNANCPEDIGPDYDFSASPVLATRPNGSDIIVVPQKSGMAYALDPDNRGELVWEYRVGPGSAVGGVWGAAVDDELAYVAVGGYFSPQTGGIHGIDLNTGEARWVADPVADLLCSGGQGCGPTQSAAVTAIPGAVFSGAQDGGMRAYSSENGDILWQFDANQTFATVNGVEASGASFDGPGPVVANGMLYFLSGNAGFVGRPGNVLLAFEIDAPGEIQAEE